jgi:hypothetical protein
MIVNLRILTASLLFLLLLTPLQAAAKIAVDNKNISAERWFKDYYAPVWKNGETLTLLNLSKFYHPTGFIRQQGKLIKWQFPDTFKELLLSVKKSGWKSAQVLSIQTKKLNKNTAILTVVWQTDYAEKTGAISCEWYLADFNEGRWQFTQFGFMKCL